MISEEMYLFSLPGFPSECSTSAGLYWPEKQAQLFGGSSPKDLPLFHITCCLPLTCNAGQSDSERLLWRLNRIFHGCTDVEKWSHQLGYKFLLSRNGQEVNIIRLAVMNR